MTRPPRFWPLAALILLPVLVLAAVAVWFLASLRRVVMTDARAVAQMIASGTAQQVDQRSTEGGDADAVTLYEPVPIPGPASPQAVELEGALQPLDRDVLTRLGSAKESQGLTASGLPVRVLAAWTLFQADAFGYNGMAYRLSRLAIQEEPSAISERIVQALRKVMPSAEAEWTYTEGQRNELRRAMAAGLLPPVPPADEADGDRVTEKEHTVTLLSASQPHPYAVRPRYTLNGLRALPGVAPPDSSGLVRIRRLSDGRSAVLLHDWLPLDAVKMAPVQNRWSRVEICEARAAFPRGQPGLLAVESRPGYVVAVRLADESALYAGYYRFVWWAAAVIGGAFFTAALGLWLLRRTLNKERRLGELKSQFVSSVSHELRAPVGSLRLMADGLASGKVSGPAADEFHRLMAGEGARLSSLIENVLDFARIEEGRKHYVMAETDITSLVQDAVKLMTPLAGARGMKIITELNPLPFVPRVDAGALQQALINLLDNAIKFTPPTVARPSRPQPANEENSVGQDARATVDESAILVSLAADPSRNSWSLTVTDHGPGIPKEEHARIFERFYRLGNELRRETTGTGIGLAIVKHVVEGHGGTVEVKSEIGNGSAFRMEFGGKAKV